MAKLNFKSVALLISLIFVGFTASAQSIKDVKINEVLVLNEGVNADRYGKFGSWIELHNTGYASMNVGGCFLSLENKNLENEVYSTNKGLTYRIPTSAAGLTTIAPGQFLLIFCEGNSEKGPEFANFSLEGASTIYWIDASGKVLLDSFDIDQNLVKPNVSLGREVLSYKDMMVKLSEGGEFEIVEYTAPTPASINKEHLDKSASEQMMERDPAGNGMAIIAMGVVFSALLVLFLIFKVVGIANQNFEKRKELKTKSASTKTADAAPAKPVNQLEANGEVIAAIAYVLKQYRTDVDNMESNILTINKTARSYSPWSSKIHGLTQQPNRK